MRYSNFPFMHYARSINIFEVFERIDLVAVIAWLITSIFRLCILLLLSITAFRVLFNKDNNEKVILMIIGISTSVLSFYILNMTSVMIFREYIDKFLNLLLIIFGILIPSITCIVYFIRRETIESKNPFN